MRFERRSTTIPALAEQIDEMATIVERHRNTHAPTASITEGEPKRKLRECVAVMVWEEVDGSETVTVVGNPELGDVELKGVLHDGIYAMTHKPEQRTSF